MTSVNDMIVRYRLRDLVVHGMVNDNEPVVTTIWEHLTSPTMRFKATGRYDFFKPIAPMVMGDRDDKPIP